MIRLVAVSTALVLLAGVLAGQTSTLAPTGTLRAAFLAGNPVQARVDPQTGEARGLVVDLTRELARRLDVPFIMLPVPDAAAVIRHVQAGTADLGFLAFEEARAREVDFAGGFALMFNTYVVPAASPLRHADDADRPGVRIGAVKGQAPAMFLSGHLARAQLELVDATPGLDELTRRLGADLDAFALNAQRAQEIASATNRLRALPGSFFAVEQSFVVRKGEKARAAALDALVGELKTSGFIAASIARATLVGVRVSPPR
jgi:polar amino acid transport system substrate-binding protein